MQKTRRRFLRDTLLTLGALATGPALLKRAATIPPPITTMIIPETVSPSVVILRDLATISYQYERPVIHTSGKVTFVKEWSDAREVVIGETYDDVIPGALVRFTRVREV